MKMPGLREKSHIITDYTYKNPEKIMIKRQQKCPQLFQNDNIFVKIDELFANFDKNILTLRKLGKISVPFSTFSHDFCQCTALTT